MINLIRTKEHKWIFQKNISSKEIILQFLSIVENLKNRADNGQLLEGYKVSGLYSGRSEQGSENTMGVRRSEMKFYMFGYSLLSEGKNSFFLTPMAMEMVKDKSDQNVADMALLNLFSIQYPHPFSDTLNSFKIDAGRLIIKLLLDDRLEKKIYIDEFCYFIPFLESIDEKSYDELIDSILEFRQLDFFEKDKLFKTVAKFDEVFSNVFHECNYYFFRIFQEFGVFEIIGDPDYNGGHMHVFHHGKSTKRNDAYKSRAKYSGYVKLSGKIIDKAILLTEKYSCFEKPITLADDDVLSNDDFRRQLYFLNPMKYLATINEEKFGRNNDVSNVISNMVHMSKYGSRDGKSFEESLKEVFDLFKQTLKAEVISGSGDTDVLCAMKDCENDEIYKINVDGKTSSNSTSMLNQQRLTKHLKLHNSKYCIVVSPRFARGVKDDIEGSEIVAINAETLADYCINEFNESEDGFIDYEPMNEMINSNLGSNITDVVQEYIEEHFSI